MKKTRLFKYLIGAFLILSISAGLFVACDKEEENTEPPTEDFDYMNADLSKYVSLDKSAYMNANVTISDVYEVNDKNVQEYIKGLLKEYPQKVTDPVRETDRPIKDGDTVYIYYEGLLDGVAFDGGTYAETETSKPYELVIGSGSFIDGFEDGLIGIVPSETSKQNPAKLNLKFPDSYSQSPDLAGKAVVFNVYVKYIYNETYPPEYNEDTIVNILKFEAEGDDVMAEFEDYIKTCLKEEQDSAAVAALSETLLKNLTVKSYPKQSVDYWYATYSAQIQQYVDLYAQYGMQVTFDQMAIQMLGLSEGDDWDAELKKFSEETCKSYMVYFYIAQQNNLTVTDEEYNAQIDDIIEYYKDQGKTYTKDDAIKEYGERTIRENLLIQKVNEFLASNLNVSFKAEESK